MRRGTVRDEARERRKMRIMLTVTVLALVWVLASAIPSPFVIERPGPVVDTLGEVQLAEEQGPVVQIDGAQTHPTGGRLNLLTVTIHGTREHPSDWLSLIPGLVDPTQRIVPVDQLFPEGQTDEDREQQNQALMGSSQVDAAAAALHELGEPAPSELVVGTVAEDGPSAGVLQEGDRILTAAGTPVSVLDELRGRIAESGADEPIAIEIEREGERRTESIVPVLLEGVEEPLIGVGILTEYDLPFEIDISLEDIGGPSAGAIFALAIYDKLTPGELTGGLNVSGTGTVDGMGRIGPIGGLEQKMWGAERAGSDLLLMPLANCGEVPDRVPDMTIAPVETLGEAVAAIETVREGREPAGLERCDALVSSAR